MKRYNIYKHYAELSFHRKHKIREGYAIENDTDPILEAVFDTKEEAYDYFKKCKPIIYTFQTCMTFYGMNEYSLDVDDDEDCDFYESIDAKYVDLNDLRDL